MTTHTEELLSVSAAADPGGRDLIHSLVLAAAGKPDARTAWATLLTAHADLQRRCDLAAAGQDEDAFGAAVDAVDAAERLLLKSAAPDIEALRWKFDCLGREVAAGHRVREDELAALRADAEALISASRPELLA